jgi:acetyl esterase
MSSILQKVAPIGEARDREILRNASTFVYATRPEGEIQAHVFFPETPAKSPMPVVVFFHGGFWDSAMPTQFVPHCLHFTSRGAVAIAVETRTASKHGTGPLEALEDARELVRWVRSNEETFRIDPDRLTVGGAAGGAYLALMTALPKPNQMGEPADAPSCAPQALVLFSALVNTTPKGRCAERFPDPKCAKKLSPSNLLRRKLPPMLFFHGKSDRITPFDEVASFKRRLRWRGNRCELVDYERADHSFFNFNVSQMHFELTIEAADRFLTDLGLLDAPPPNDFPT